MAAFVDRVFNVMMGGMTKDPQEQRNVFWRTVAMLLTGAAITLFGAELWQGFLVKTGFSMTRIGLLGSVGTFSGAAGLLLFMGLADRIQRRIRTYSICVAVLAAVPVIVSAMAFVPRSLLSLSGLLFMLIALSIGQQLLNAIPTMLDYAIFVRTFRVGIRGRVFAILTWSQGLLGIAVGVLSAKVLKDLPYPGGYVACFVAAGVMTLLRAGSFLVQRELPDLAVPGASRSPLPFAAIVDVLKMKEFQWLGPPHVVRGLVSGGMGLAVAAGLKYLELPQQYPGYAAAATQAALVLGGIVLGVTADRWGAGICTLLADILFAFGLATLLLSHNPLVYVVLYFVTQFGLNVEGSAVPFGCSVIVPPELMGAFSAARLMVLTGFGAVGALLFGVLLDYFSPVAVFGVMSGMKLINGVWFWYVFRLKQPMATEAELDGGTEGAASP